MTDPEQPEPQPERPLTGPARDFAAFIELEYERRMSSERDFDPELFREAVDLVLGKLRA
jgi:hypothetical protein